MRSYSKNQKDQLYYLVRTIVNDKQIRKIIYIMSDADIQYIIYCLDHKMNDHLWESLKAISKNKLVDSDLTTQVMIDYYNKSIHSQLAMLDVLRISKLVLMKAGAKEKKGFSLSLSSILDREFDKNAIDENLRTGAANRKAHEKKLH